MTYTAQSCREEAAINDKFGDPIMNDPDILRAHADALDKLASIEAAQGEDVRGPVERLKEARRIVWSMCADGRPPRMSIPAEDTDEDVFIVDTITATIALLESLSAKLAEREAEVSDYKCRAQMNADAIQHYSERAEKATAECEHWKKNAASCHIERDVHAAMIERAEKAEAEVARLKAHAEAMATWCALVNNGVCDFRTPMPHEEYRHDYPEGTK